VTLIRNVSKTDADDLALIGERTLALACPATTPEADLRSYIAAEFNPEKFRQYINDPNATIYGAEVSGRVIGYCLLYRAQPPLEILCDRAIGLKRLYVLPEFHGRGVAQDLMQTSLKFALDHQYSQVWLSVSNQNLRAISFYKKSGFVKVGEQKFYVGNDIHDDDIMLNRLI
jgi:ribosomal protein S18 acetylase RimI-like enzyme